MIWNKEKIAKDEYKVLLGVISCKNSMVKSLKYSISAGKDLTMKMDFKAENGLMIPYHCRNSKCMHRGMCVLLYFLYMHCTCTFTYIKMYVYIKVICKGYKKQYSNSGAKICSVVQYSGLLHNGASYKGFGKQPQSWPES